MQTFKTICALAVTSTGIAQAWYEKAPEACCNLYTSYNYDGPIYTLCAGQDSLLPLGIRNEVKSWVCGTNTKVEFCEDAGECKKS